MKTQEHALQLKAKEALGYFKKGKRNNGHEYWYTQAKCGDVPQWLQDLCHDAHGDMLPDDWKYEFIVEALHALADCEDPDDISLDADIYTAHLTAWLASHLDRIAYCDQWSHDTDCAGDTIQLLSGGQYIEKNEVLASVRQSLEKQITE